MLICTLAIAIAVLIIYVHERVFLHLYEPPHWLSIILWCKMYHANDLTSLKNGEIPKSAHGTSDETILNDLRLFHEMVRSEIGKRRNEEFIRYHWSIIIDRMDLILLIGFQIGNIFFACWLMVKPVV